MMLKIGDHAIIINDDVAIASAFHYTIGRHVIIVDTIDNDRWFIKPLDTKNLSPFQITEMQHIMFSTNHLKPVSSLNIF